MTAWIAFVAGVVFVLALFAALIAALTDRWGVMVVAGYSAVFCAVVLLSLAVVAVSR
jgi:hypothetical protein